MTIKEILNEPRLVFRKWNATARILVSFLAALAIPHPLSAAGPAPVDLGTTANFVILSGAGITTTGGGIITGNIGASPISGAAIGVGCAQIVGTIYAVDAAGPPCAIIDSVRLTTAKGDLTTAFNDAAGRIPVPTGPNLNPGLIPGSGNIGGMVLAPGLYKFTTTALITGADVTFAGGADDVWIFQCAQDLQLASGIKIILAGGAQAKNIFWQVGTSAVLDTSSVFKGTILADQSITMKTSSTIEGRMLAFSAGVVFNGNGAAVPTSPEIAVEQPAGTNLVDGVSIKDFGPVLIGTNASLIFTITNSGDANLTGLGITIDGLDASLFSVTVNPVAPLSPAGSTPFTVRFAPLSAGVKTAALHIANNDSDENPFDIILTGTGTLVPVPEIGVQQPAGTDLIDGISSRDFGAPLIGANTSLIFTITNSGTANLTGLGITIDGLDAALFSVTVNPVAPLSPSGSTPFTVRFAPLTSGLKTAALHIANNDSNENPFDIILTGTGTLVPVPEIGVQQPAGTDLIDGISSRDFGAPLIGANTSLIFTITNSGTANLTGLGITIDGLDASLFSVTVNPVAPLTPNGSTPFTVRFAPLTSGLKTAALHIANNDSDENPFDIILTGTGTLVPVPEIGVQQPAGTDLIDGISSRDFGAPLIGANTSLIFTITNSGTANLTGLGITIDGVDASLFSVTVNPVAPLTPNGSTPFTVRFAPLSTGVKTAALHIANNDSNENPFDIILTGTGTLVPAPEIGVQQPAGTDLIDGVTSRDFGAPLIGANTSLIFTITNSGTANLTGLGITIDGVDAALFTVIANPVAPLSPNGSTPFTVRFAPLTSGLKTAALHIANNDSDENPFDIIITGTGTLVPVPEIGVQQPAGTDLVDGVSIKDFGAPLVGASTSLIFTITNSGTANLTGLGITIDGADAALFTVTINPVAPLSPAGSTPFTVRFSPLTTGVKLAALHIANNDSDENPFDITLTGTGTLVPAPEIAVSQPAGSDLVDGVSSRDFGAPLIGASTSLIFTITNSGTANLTGLGITIDGADAASFSVTANPTAPVAPNGSTTFTVRFAPLTAGAKTAALHIANNDSNENPFDIIITGTGTLVPAPEIAVSQPAGTDLVDGVSVKDFGAPLIGASTSLIFTITNSGTANLTGLDITIDGVDAALFSVTSSPTAPVVPNGSTTFTIRFAPLSVGGKLAALHIANNDADENPFDLILTGTGTVVPTPEIAVSQPVGTDLVDGVSITDFGPVLVGANNSLTFTIANIGTADLTGLDITIDGVDAALFSVTSSPTAPVVPNGSTTFTVLFAPLSAGVKLAALHIANNDSNENPFDLILAGTGTGAFVTSISPITLNPQTGFFEQTVRVIDSIPGNIAALRLLIQGLPGDVEVHNAAGTSGGFPYLQHDYPLTETTSIDFLVEYYRFSREPFAQPVFVALEAVPIAATANGEIQPIDRNMQLLNGRFLIEFSTIPGRTYAVQYSSDLNNWTTAIPTITAPANKVQWYDDGPPKTESKPSAGSRFYRVVLLP